MVSAGDEKLAKKFKKEVRPEPLPPNSLRLADIVKIYQKENTPVKRKAEPLMNVRDVKKARQVRMEHLSCALNISSLHGVKKYFKHKALVSVNNLLQ